MLSFTSSHYSEIQSFLQDCYNSIECDEILSEQSTYFLIQIYTFSKNKQFPQLLEINELLKLDECIRNTSSKRNVKKSHLRTEIDIEETV
jgi:hypothetical protein